MFRGNFDAADFEGFDGLKVAIAVAVECGCLYCSLGGKAGKGDFVEESMLGEKHDSNSKASSCVPLE